MLRLDNLPPDQCPLSPNGADQYPSVAKARFPPSTGIRATRNERQLSVSGKEALNV